MKKCLAVVLIISICISFAACGMKPDGKPQQEETFQTLVTEPDKTENGILVYKNGYPGVYSIITDEKTVQFLRDSLSQYEQWEAVPDDEQRSFQADFYFDCGNGLAFSVGFNKNLNMDYNQEMYVDDAGTGKLQHAYYGCAGERIEQAGSNCTLMNAGAEMHYFSPEVIANTLYYMQGQLERRMYENAGTPVIKAKHFKIFSNELACLEQQLSWQGSADPAETAENMLIKKYALFYEAKRAGFTGGGGYAAFLAGTGATNEEYWHFRKEEVKMGLLIGAWENHLQEEFYRDHGSSGDWNAYYEELKNSIIDGENAHHVDN